MVDKIKEKGQEPIYFKISSTFRIALILFFLVGVFSFFLGLRFYPERTWIHFLQNHFYFMSLSLGGLFFVALQWVTGAVWSVSIRRISESFTAYLPWVFISFGILIFGVPKLYLWSDPSHVQGDLILEGKAGYLSLGFFVFRNLCAIALWWFFSKKMVGNSLAQDTHKIFLYTQKNRFLAPIFLIFFAITFTLVSFDQIMSLDPHWFSTLFGIYCFSGLFYSSLAAICLLSLYLKSKGKLDGILTEHHLHDLGKFLFAFTIFWAYIAFSQYMLIWYANLPEETSYYIKRTSGSWFWVSLFLLLGKFFVPFFLLLTRYAKRSSKILFGVCVFMLFAQWVDVLWMVQPEFFDSPRFGWLELGVTLGFIGVFGLSIVHFLSKHSIIASGDPDFRTSIAHHQA